VSDRAVSQVYLQAMFGNVYVPAVSMSRDEL
jgi:hypothetical protein